VIVGMLLVANIINLGADLGAMGEALRLLVGGPVHLYVGSSVPRTEFPLDSPLEGGSQLRTRL
jgi:hypothetical protein